MRASPDFYDGDRLDDDMSPAELLDDTFAIWSVNGMTGQPGWFQLKLGGWEGWFSRNSIQGMLEELDQRLRGCPATTGVSAATPDEGIEIPLEDHVL